MEVLPSVSKEFLEGILHEKVESFKMSPGTNVGDNYTSVLYSFDVKLKQEEDNNNKNETVHLLSKCFPSNPTRQITLNTTNLFWNELSIYRVLMPELLSLSKKVGMDETVLFPPLVGGNAVNFQKLRELHDKTYDGKVFDPFDIYIMMTDIRKTWGFRMADRRKGLDIDEVKLVITALARLHALSWGYKKLNNLNTLLDKFDFLQFRISEDGKEMWTRLLQGNIDLAADTVETITGPNSDVGNHIRKVKGHSYDMMEIAYTESMREENFYEAHRITPSERVEEEQWRVLLHGDCWTNNLMFRYDESTNKAVEVILVDLQAMRQHCPTIDLVYLLYCSTTTEFRIAHLNTILNIYHDQFVNNCQKLGVPTLPNFSLKELKRRFHRSKIMGFFLATLFLPIMLKDAKDIVDMETIKVNDVSEMYDNYTTATGNDLYTKWMYATAMELHDQGVL